MVTGFFRLLIVLLFTVSLPVSAESSGAVGWIDTFDGSPDIYTLEHGGIPTEVMFYRTLYAGDVVTVKQEGYQIIIRRRDNSKPLVVTKESSPHTVSQAKSGTIVGNIFEWVGDLFNQLHKNPHTIAISAHSRGSEAPRSPMLDHGNLRVIEGRRSLVFAWVGGKSPFIVRLEKDGVQIYETTVDVSGTPIGPVDLSPGDYRLFILSESGHGYSAPFEVVSIGQQPIGPPGLEENKMPEDVEKTLMATWLSGQNNGAWVIEAYQLLAPVAQSYYPAELMRQALAEGGVVTLD